MPQTLDLPFLRSGPPVEGWTSANHEGNLSAPDPWTWNVLETSSGRSYQPFPVERDGEGVSVNPLAMEPGRAYRFFMAGRPFIAIRETDEEIVVYAIVPKDA